MKLVPFDPQPWNLSSTQTGISVSSNTEASDAASGRGGSVCKLLPDEDLNRGGWKPEGKVKASLSYPISLARSAGSACYVNTCVFPGRRDARSCLLNEYYQSSEGECSRRCVWARGFGFSSQDSRPEARLGLWARTWQKERFVADFSCNEDG